MDIKCVYLCIYGSFFTCETFQANDFQVYKSPYKLNLKQILISQDKTREAGLNQTAGFCPLQTEESNKLLLLVYFSILELRSHQMQRAAHLQQKEFQVTLTEGKI